MPPINPPADKPRKCVACGNEFILRVSPRQAYCSFTCRNKFYAKKYYVRFEWRKERKCHVCDSAYVPNTKRQMSCSLLCKKEHHRSLIQRWKVQNPEKYIAISRKASKTRWRKDGLKKSLASWVEKKCEVCEKVFLPSYGNHRKAKFCSLRCRRTDTARRTNAKKRFLHQNPESDRGAYDNMIQREKIGIWNAQLKRRRCAEGCEKAHIHSFEWTAILEKYGHKCGICGKEGTDENPLGIDHIFPTSKGGQHEITNIQPSHHSCNARKGNKTVTSFPQEMQKE